MPPDSTITVPSALLDATLRHRVNLDRFANGTVKDIIGLLNDSDKDLTDLIQKRGNVKNFTTDRLNALLEETKKIIAEGYSASESKLAESLVGLAGSEVDFNGALWDKLTFGKLDIVTPSAEKLAAIVTDQPFQGALLSEWFGKLATDKQHGVTQALRLGQSQGETIDQMVRRLTGSAKDYQAGIYGRVRNDTEAVVRTAVNHTSNNAQQLLLKQNDDLMQGWTFCATLDGRTTLICASLSGTKWPIGDGPIPPRHFRCRSFALPLLKTWKDLGIDLEEIPPGTRAAVGGPIRADMSFNDWLKGQDRAVQDEILGKTRGELFRKGGLTVDKFADSTGNVYSLAQLKEKQGAVIAKVFPEGMPATEGGGHLGKTIPVTGPKDFSHVLAPVYATDAVSAANEAANVRNALRTAAATKTDGDVLPMLGSPDQITPELEKKWKAYKPQIKGKLVKGLDLTNAEQKILSEIPAEEKAAFDQLVSDAKVKVQGTSTVGKTLLKEVLPVTSPSSAVWNNTADFKKLANQFKDLNLGTLLIDNTYATDSKVVMDVLGPTVFKKVNALGTELATLLNDFPSLADTIKKNPLKKLSIENKATVSFIDAQDKTSHAVGLYFKKEKQLSLAVNTVAKDFPFKPGQWSVGDGGNYVKAAKHELGHHIYELHDTKDWVSLFHLYEQDIPEILTKYAKTNAGEFFSEAFALFTDKEYITGMLPSKIELELEKFIGKKMAATKTADDAAAILAKTKKAAEEAIAKAAAKKAAEEAAAAAAAKAAEEAAAVAAKKAAEEVAAAAKKTAEEAAINEKKIAAFDEAMQKKWKAYKPQIKGKLVNGKDLSAAEQKILGEVPKHEYEDLMTKVDEALAKKGIEPKVPPPPPVGTQTATIGKTVPAKPATMHIDDFEKVGGQLGSNAGGTYVNRATGEQFYIKMPGDTSIAQNEVMASQLYKLAGVDMADLQLIDLGGGKWGVASKWVNGLESNPKLLMSGKAAGIFDGFATDAWLANWDVIGLNYDNMKILNGATAVRVDPGGALFYRAQGGLKQFGPQVTEIKTLLDAGVNPQSASVFRNMTQEQLHDSVRRVLRLKEVDIRATVENVATQWTPAKRKELVDILLARQQDLAKQFPELVEKEILTGGKARLTQEDFWRIRNARGNGRAIRIDYNQIEDQQILFNVERQANGVDNVVGTFKVRDTAVNVLEKFIKQTGSPVGGGELLIKGFTAADNDVLYNSMLQTVKGIASQAQTATGVLRFKDIERADDALYRLGVIKKQILASNGMIDASFQEHFSAWENWLTKVASSKEGAAAKQFVPEKVLVQFKLPMKISEVQETAPIQFFKRNGTFQKANIDRGNIIRTNVEQSLSVGGSNYFYETEVDGIKIRYWPKNDSNVSYTLQGRMQVITKEASAESINKAIDFLEKLGLNVDNPSAQQMEEMYLQKIAYHLNGANYTTTANQINRLENPAARVSAWQSYLNSALKIPDITKLPEYNPKGSLEMFDTGQLLFKRPDLHGPAWERFSDKYRIQHQFWSGDYIGGFDRILDSGGKLTSSADRVRRGIPWGNSSAAADFASGGADYVFTRIKPLSEQNSKTGIYWKPNNHLKRMDAISYADDAYGQVRPAAPVGWGKHPRTELGENGFVIANRSATNPTEWAKIAGKGRNETIFKNGLSIFEDVDIIRVPADQYERVLEVFRKHGMTEWPDGRALTKVIVK